MDRLDSGVLILVLISLAGCIIATCAGCATTTTRTTESNGAVVRVTQIATDPVALAELTASLNEYLLMREEAERVVQQMRLDALISVLREAIVRVGAAKRGGGENAAEALMSIRAMRCTWATAAPSSLERAQAEAEMDAVSMIVEDLCTKQVLRRD